MASLTLKKAILVLVVSCSVWISTEAQCTTNTVGANTNQGLIISSPNYPSNYDNGADLCWIITTPASGLDITVPSYDLEDSADFLSIYDGNNADGTLMARLSGTFSESETYFGGETIFIQFTSDDLVTNQGFELCVYPTGSSVTCNYRNSENNNNNNNNGNNGNGNGGTGSGTGGSGDGASAVILLLIIILLIVVLFVCGSAFVLILVFSRPRRSKFAAQGKA